MKTGLGVGREQELSLGRFNSEMIIVHPRRVIKQAGGAIWSVRGRYFLLCSSIYENYTTAWAEVCDMRHHNVHESRGKASTFPTRLQTLCKQGLNFVHFCASSTLQSAENTVGV